MSKKRSEVKQFNNTAHFIDWFIDKYSLNLDENLQFRDKNNNIIEDIHFQLLQEYDLIPSENRENILMSRMNEFLDQKVVEVIGNKLKEIQNRITLSPEDPLHLEKCQAGREELTKMIDICFPYHWYATKEECDKSRMLFFIGIHNVVWQVKSRAFGNPWKFNPLLMIFGGGQRLGKSEICLKILEPFRPFVVEDAELDALTDMSKNFALWRDNLVIVCDDTSGASKSDVAKLKKNLTGNWFTVRKYFSQTMKRFFKRGTVIGSSNEEMRDVIRDPTGNGRILEIQILRKLNITELIKIDMTKIVQAISVPTMTQCFEMWEPIYEKHVYPHQAATKTEDLLDQIITELGLSVNEDPKKNKAYCANKIFKDAVCLCDWMSGVKLKLTPSDFRRKLCNKLKTRIGPRIGSTNYPIYLDKEKIRLNAVDSIKNYASPLSDNSDKLVIEPSPNNSLQPQPKVVN